MSRHQWKFIGFIVNPDEESVFASIFVDTTGVHSEEMEVYVTFEDVDRVLCYRFPIQRCVIENGILLDSDKGDGLKAWFSDNISKTAFHLKEDPDFFLKGFTSRDVKQRALAYLRLGNYLGYEKFDEYPEIITVEEKESLVAQLLQKLQEEIAFPV